MPAKRPSGLSPQRSVDKSKYTLCFNILDDNKLRISLLKHNENILN